MSSKLGSLSFSLLTSFHVRASTSVGNIPYDATEEQLKPIFAKVGEVVSLRYDSLETHFPTSF